MRGALLAAVAPGAACPVLHGHILPTSAARARLSQADPGRAVWEHSQEPCWAQSSASSQGWASRST